MTWFLAGALACSLLYIGRILLGWKATTQLFYVAGWKQAMKLRDEWDNVQKMNMKCETMWKSTVSRNGKDLVN